MTAAVLGTFCVLAIAICYATGALDELHAVLFAPSPRSKAERRRDAARTLRRHLDDAPTVCYRRS